MERERRCFPVNLAIIFAKMGKRVCLLDLDLRAPSLHSTFKNGKKHWVNDFLNKACTIDNVLTDCSTEAMGKGKLLVGLANPSTETIREMAAKDRKWEMEALGRLLSLKMSLLTICTSIMYSLIPARVFNLYKCHR